MHISEMQKQVYENSKAHGWLDRKREVPELLCLIHSEVSEALEAYRKREDEHLGEELADVVIRVMDTCNELGIDLENEVIHKHSQNLSRPYKHGNKRC